MKWQQITVTTTTEGSDLVSSVLYDYGSDGVSIADKNDVLALIKEKKNWDYVDDDLLNPGDGKVLVSGFFAEDFNPAELYSALVALKEDSFFPMGAMEVTRSYINSEDWENEWRKYYAPIKIGKTVIVPAWQKYHAENGEIPVYIEPGMAFGTGNHETTSMCVELMQSLDLSCKRVADVGCGSGILGIVALSLGAKNCVFNDIDPLATKATHENLILNGFTACDIITGDLYVGKHKFDVVLANLTADLLLRLKDMLSSLCNKGGKIIISGIINARAEQIYSAFSSDLKPVTVLKRGEWQAMMFECV